MRGRDEHMLKNLTDTIEVLEWSENITLKHVEPFRQAMNKLVNGTKKQLILNLVGTNYINSAGLGIIAEGAMDARRNQKEVVITDIQPSVKEIFSIVKFTSFMKMFESEQEAIAYFMVNHNETENI